MSARDDFGSRSGTPGGYGDRAGGLGNGGIGGGMGGGQGGGGAGRNGGIGSRTGLTTGNKMIGGRATGRPGGYAQNPGAWGLHAWPSVSQSPLTRPARPAVPGLLTQTPVPPVEQPVIGYLPGWPGTGLWWGDQPPWNNNPVPAAAPPPAKQYYDRVPQDPNWRAPTIPAGMGFQPAQQNGGPGGDQWGPTPSNDYDHWTDHY